MSDEMLAKTKLLVKNILLNPKAQSDWINNADAKVLSALGAFARLFIEPDNNLTKVDAFRAGVIIGALYESMRLENERKKSA
jgi:hypothetical protein